MTVDGLKLLLADYLIMLTEVREENTKLKAEIKRLTEKDMGKKEDKQ